MSNKPDTQVSEQLAAHAKIALRDDTKWGEFVNDLTHAATQHLTPEQLQRLGKYVEGVDARGERELLAHKLIDLVNGAPFDETIAPKPGQTSLDANIRKMIEFSRDLASTAPADMIRAYAFHGKSKDDGGTWVDLDAKRLNAQLKQIVGGPFHAVSWETAEKTLLWVIAKDGTVGSTVWLRQKPDAKLARAGAPLKIPRPGGKFISAPTVHFKPENVMALHEDDLEGIRMEFYTVGGGKTPDDIGRRDLEAPLSTQVDIGEEMHKAGGASPHGGLPAADKSRFPIDDNRKCNCRKSTRLKQRQPPPRLARVVPISRRLLGRPSRQMDRPHQGPSL